MDVKADNATVIMSCSGVDARVHLHAFVIMSKSGSNALAKIALDNIITKSMKELSA
jgi:hypothetical protein